jgi:hypothetical protein
MYAVRLVRQGGGVTYVGPFRDQELAHAWMRSHTQGCLQVSSYALTAPEDYRP